jgi:hypothetical protein
MLPSCEALLVVFRSAFSHGTTGFFQDNHLQNGYKEDEKMAHLHGAPALPKQNDEATNVLLVGLSTLVAVDRVTPPLLLARDATNQNRAMR